MAEIRVHSSIKWIQTLSTVLLGLKSALRGDANYTIVQMVCGHQPIRLPGELKKKKNHWIPIRLLKNYRYKWKSLNY